MLKPGTNGRSRRLRHGKAGAASLVTWVADRDFEVAEGKRRVGPIANLLLQPPCPVDSVLVLHEKSDPLERVNAFRRWLSGRTTAKIEFHATDPIDDAHAYSQLYPLVRDLVQRVLDDNPGRVVLLNGSSGRPVKHAIFMLLATPNPRLKLLSCWSEDRPIATLDLPFSVAVDFARSTTAQAISEFAAGRSLTREEADAFSNVGGKSPAIAAATRAAASVAVHDLTVLILGETGTGKEEFAKAIHRLSRHASGRFVPVNCGAIPETLIDAELFGVKRGAFTGADRDRKGLFQQANGGTLFLDEIGELPLRSQASLLRAMNSTPSRIRPVGGLDEEEAYVRIVAATHRDLPALVREGRFREDLWYRLSTAIVQLPPLRDRGSDLELLIDELWHSLTEHTRGVPAKTLSPAARRVLRSHAWPGNIRELMATLSRLRIQANDAEVSAADARAALAVMSPADHGISILDRPLREGDFGIQQVVDEVKRHYIRRALADAGGNKSRAARLLGLSNHSVLNDWMRALEIRRGRSS